MRVAYSDHSTNPVCGFGSAKPVLHGTNSTETNLLHNVETTYRVGWLIWICYSRALERRCLDGRIAVLHKPLHLSICMACSHLLWGAKWAGCGKKKGGSVKYDFQFNSIPFGVLFPCAGLLASFIQFSRWTNECLNSLVAKFATKCFRKFPRPVGHTTAAV